MRLSAYHFALAIFGLLSTAGPAVAAEEVTGAPAQTCAAPDGGLPVSRVVEIDTAAGPIYGDITTQVKEDSFLTEKEVVLTFDDGPMPWVTGSILDTLDEFCTKATFFSVGKMAIAYPATLRKIVGKGHTLGGHTWSHPLNLKRLKLDKAMDEIERGFAAISLASGGNAVPFFRFPGLSDNAAMLDALQKRGIASFSVDVVSNDSYTNSPAKVISTTLSSLEGRKRGILLFHDIKPATAKALPTLLRELKKRGYKVVHMRAKKPLEPLPEMAAALQPVLAKKDPPQGQAVAKAAMMPFFGAVGPQRMAAAAVADEPISASNDIAVQALAPQPRDRNIAKSKPSESKSSERESASKGEQPAKSKTVLARKQVAARRSESDRLMLRQPSVDGWSTRVRKERLNRTYFD